MFRNLRADEIECRVSTIKENGLSLLLYKNARCDMNILDETVGNLNWQRGHSENKGNLFCSIGINRNYKNPDLPPEWVWKEDCGTESYAEKEKGEASDSFKRAGFNWGIGRELYTAPFIWVKDCKISKNNKGKFECWDKFYVSRIEISKEKVIEKLEIRVGNKVVFSMGYGKIEEIKPEYDEIICSKCGKVILKQKLKGEIRTPREIVDTLGCCVDCYRKAEFAKKVANYEA